MTKRIIPDVVVKHKDQLGRDLALERYSDRYKKSYIIAYTLWFLFCMLGAHRIYLGQWKHALCLFFIALALIFFLDRPLMSGFSGIIVLLIFFAEGIWLFWSMQDSYKNLRRRLAKEINDVPYVPLSGKTNL